MYSFSSPNSSISPNNGQVSPSFINNSVEKSSASENPSSCMPVTIRLLRQSVLNSTSSSPNSDTSVAPASGGSPNQGVYIHSHPTALVTLCGWVVSVQDLRSQRRVWISDGTGKILIQASVPTQQELDTSFQEGDVVRVVGVCIHTSSKQQELGEDSCYISASSLKPISKKEYAEFAYIEVMYAAASLLYSDDGNERANSKYLDDRKRKNEPQNLDLIDLPSIYDQADSDIEKDIIRYLTIHQTVAISELISGLSHRYQGENLNEALEHLKIMDLVVCEDSTVSLTFLPN